MTHRRFLIAEAVLRLMSRRSLQEIDLVPHLGELLVVF